MSVITAVKYDVLEHILKKWLEENFGDQAAYEVVPLPLASGFLSFLFSGLSPATIY